MNGHKTGFWKIVKCFYEVFTTILFSAASPDSLEAEFEQPGQSLAGKSPFLWCLYPGGLVPTIAHPELVKADKETHLCY